MRKRPSSGLSKRPSDTRYSFKILQSQPATIHYRLIRAPSKLRERVAQWLSGIRIR